MQGAITGKDVILHWRTIVRLWGWSTYLSCLRAALGRRPSTFLRALYPAVQPSAALGSRYRRS
jgi:hypothetical protein